MLRVLAVDDEEPALAELMYLLRADARVGQVEGATDATGALRRIGRALESGPDAEDAFDVLFLDIRMAGLTGLDVARLLAGFARPPLIVFVTAHEDFAVQAFDLKAVDYLLKPVRKERLAEAVSRVAEQLAVIRRSGDHAPADRTPAGGTDRVRTVGAEGVPNAGADRIPVELGGVVRLLAVADITYAEAQGDYARLHTPDGSHLVRIPLATLEERWEPYGFVRIHRSHLVALHRIDELRLDGGGMSVRIGGAQLAVSRRHASRVRELLVRRAGN
ncbi:LytTR family DNA-binding domain-containing protein [Streptomyces sp. TS71-3]|uniref:LytR/AlgR family response regulator transcription factor n=1 Tax=Streptomyces sp. TS71-3 TaxID=2733862 RepID=UPI001B282320|nr:LytTR family DNA-binding domain-containing protein [Streptomyces sp. TS71-3]GHJ42118.1 DNA-binding response regulator [Streptomyces sp. TS71-3]